MPRFLFTVLTVLLSLSAVESNAQEVRQPNIVLILIDDMGYTDVGRFGSTLYETPHIDRMAAEGMQYTDAYAASPVCSPTRASIMTGRNPARLRLTNFLKGLRSPEDSPILTAEYADFLSPDEVTIAEVLKAAGYATGFVGKWHLAHKETEGTLPEDQGFDVNIGGTHAGMPRAFFWPGWEGNPPVEGNFENEYLPDRLSHEAVQFIKTYRDEPFFLYLAHYAVHIPIQARAEKVARYRAKIETEPPIAGRQNNAFYAAMVESVDESVGRVLAVLSELDLDDNTIVFFFSDNGGLSVPEGPLTPATTNTPLRAGKGFLYEGGIRVPLIVRWPAEIAPNSRCTEPVISDDFFPTIAEIAGLDPAQIPTRGPLDGLSLLPLLTNPGASLKREALYWHYPHFSNQGGRPGGAIRTGRWKLIERYENGDLELYDLESDTGEYVNLVDTHREKASELHQKLVEWREGIGANMPPPNPAYDSAATE